MSVLRHLTLNSLVSVKNNLKKYVDEIVICIDSKHYWRKDLFPYYKQNRKKAKDKDTFDWDSFFIHFNQLKDEFRDNLSHKVLEVDGAEADDIMAILSSTFGPTKQVVIVSSDKDLLQVSSNICDKVKQYSPFHKKLISGGDKYSLFTHVIKGDEGDGIPNIFSDDDVHVTPGKRQIPIKTVKLEEWEKNGGLNSPELYCKTADDLRRFERNRTLIDFTQIPKDLSDKILDAYHSTVPQKARIFNYLVKHKLRSIIDQGGF